MSWIGWTAIGILAMNVIVFGGMMVNFILEERKREK